VKYSGVKAFLFCNRGTMERTYFSKKDLEEKLTETVRHPIVCNQCGTTFYHSPYFIPEEDKRKYFDRCDQHFILFHPTIVLN